MPKSHSSKLVKVNKAPLVEVDRWELTDKRLNPEEAVIREREELLKMASTKKIAGQAELEDKERSLGPRLSWNEVLYRIQKASPQIKAVDGAPGNIALYFPRTEKEWLVAKEEWDCGDRFDDEGNVVSRRVKSRFFLDYKYVGGFPKEVIPEYSTVDLDSSHLATRENRGWRSVLINLIRVGAMKYSKAVELFGEPTGSRAGRWNEELRAFRT